MPSFFENLKRQKPKVSKHSSGETQAVSGDKGEVWDKCSGCQSVLYKKSLETTNYVCPECGFHLKMTAQQRVELLTDSDSFVEIDHELIALDPLEFGPDYIDKLKKDRSKTSLSDAILTGTATLDSIPYALGVMDFRFRGGSMGSVVGEKVCRLIETATENKMPAVLVTTSGGARMQEGMLSLMQMARTSAAVKQHELAGLPYIVILTDPTTAGVAASFAALGDVILAEPKAIIGFSGARVIEQTIRQKLPEGFQTSEFYLKAGFIDQVVERKDLRDRLATFLGLFMEPVR